MSSTRPSLRVPSQIAVGVAEMRLSVAAGTTLASFGLGSCLGIAFYDRVAKVGAMLHAQLPFARDNRDLAARNPFAFVDSGMAATLDALTRRGARAARILVWAAGGATLSRHATVGDRNQLAFHATLKNFGLYADSAHLGGTSPRGITLTLPDGTVFVRYPSSELHDLRRIA